MSILRTLEHRVATHGEHVLSPEDKAELYRLRGQVSPIGETSAEPEEEIEEYDEDDEDDAD